ncbi:MAG: FAD-dependent monooxygenase [Acidobacteriota bacterium]
MDKSSHFDVVIVGGGLAGLTLARQIRLEVPDRSVAVIDRLVRPLPEAAFKVGESAIELGTYYLGQVLGLDAYFRSRHLSKLGLRFYFGDAQGPLEGRPETGADMYPPVPSYQIDRGRLENDLRQIVVDMGATLLESTTVDDVALGEGDAAHTISCRTVPDGETFTLTARWLSDASGRRRLLQSRLGLRRPNGHKASSAWWRYNGRIDIDVLGTKGGGESWRSRCVEERYFATNHLMGKGYWVWLIPLASGTTSIGIVADENIHPQHTYGKSYAQSLEWLRVNEPALHAFVSHEEPLDFMSFKDYSYGSAQIFSHRRWSCVGEAGFFLDPLYSLGNDFIGIANTTTVELIKCDRAGELTESVVAPHNELVLDVLGALCLAYSRGVYRAFGHAQVFTSKLAWDTAIYWSYMYQVYVQGFVRRPTPAVLGLGRRYRDLTQRVEQLFADWSAAAPPRSMHVVGDLRRMRFLQFLGLDLAARRSPAQMIDVATRNLDRFEELAQVLFWQAVSECHPDHPLLKTRPWINAWKITLDPAKWDEEGTLRPTTPSRGLAMMADNFTGIFAPQTAREKVLFEFPYRMMRWGKGFIYYRIVPFIRRHMFVDKPAMWARRLMGRNF